jgi:signal transduction histidine kinase
VADVAAAAAVLGLAIADLATRRYGPGWMVGNVGVVVLAATATGLRTRRPLTAAALLCATLLASAVLPDPSTPLWGFIMLLLVSYSAAAHLDGRRRISALVSVLAATYPLQLLAADNLGDQLISPVVIVGAGTVAGVTVRRSRLQTAKLAALADALRAERAQHAQLAALAERARIARDVHDIVAHSVSLMVVQAGAAVCLLPHDAPAQEQLAAVRTTGREALRELHGLLAILHEGTDETALAQPGMDELIELAQTAGARVLVRGVPWKLGQGMALTAYQVTREALTNARRHAADAAVEVEVGYEVEAVWVRITDTGLGATSAPDGHGINGMRERAAFYGGDLAAGPRPTGGWEVRLRLPATGGYKTTLAAT